MNKPTSGPWAVNGSWIVTGGGEGIGIAHVVGNIGQPVEANARLIAAAPELKEAMENCFDVLCRICRLQEAQFVNCDDCRINRDVRAALSRIEGKGER